MKPLALVIEDDADQSFIFTKSLEMAGYQIEAILDGSVAQKRLSEAIPALIVLDIHLPGVNGVDLLAQIHADRRLDGVTIILLTADGRLAEKLHDRATMTIIKPVGFAELSTLAGRFRPPTQPVPSSGLA
ncbi:MAG: response regulator [Chloroflexota bacterium]